MKNQEKRWKTKKNNEKLKKTKKNIEKRWKTKNNKDKEPFGLKVLAKKEINCSDIKGAIDSSKDK